MDEAKSKAIDAVKEKIKTDAINRMLNDVFILFSIMAILMLCVRTELESSAQLRARELTEFNRNWLPGYKRNNKFGEFYRYAIFS